MQKRVVAIHDISCFGRCSLTVALPVLSAAGIETSIIPTAVLSTHTGGFTDFTFRDLSDDILPIARHWQTLRLGFDSLYTGYLGSFEQLSIVAELFDLFQTEETLIFVDPVMADHGTFYSAFSTDFARGMTGLCSKADAIIPNMTEAAFLLGEDYNEGPYTRSYIEGLLTRLAKLGPSLVFLTGVHFDEKELGTAVYDRNTGSVSYAFAPRVPGNYHGTGDLFASVTLAALLNGKRPDQAIQTAVDFTVSSLLRSRENETDSRFGVNFEYGLGQLAQLLPPVPSARGSL